MRQTGDKAFLEVLPMVTNRSAPTAVVVPVLVYEDVEAAIAFLVRAFGCAERLRAQGPHGRLNHAQLRIGAGDIIIGRVSPRSHAGSSSRLAG